jgi:hypothetical protein
VAELSLLTDVYRASDSEQEQFLEIVEPGTAMGHERLQQGWQKSDGSLVRR